MGPRDTVAIPEGTRTLDCSGLTVVAGFQNSHVHVHFTDPARWADASSKPATRLTADLQEMLTRYGFTTVVDTASDLANTLALRRRIESGEVTGPRILTAGSALYPADGVPYAAMLAPEWRVTHIDGRVLTRAQVLEQMFPEGPSPLVDYAQDDVEVRIFGDSAVVTGRTMAHARDGRRVVLRFTDFAVKRGGTWTIVASHATQLRED